MDKEFCETVEKIAVKYAKKVEKHIDSVKENKLSELKNMYEEIQVLGNICSTLERINRTNDNK